MNESDIAVVKGILARDEQALSCFYLQYKGKLLSYLRHKVDKEEDCEELLQDTLFAFIESLRDFEGRSSIKTFLFSICQHKVIDYYRRKKIKHLVFSQIPQLEYLISPFLQPEEVLDAAIIKGKIKSALHALSPVYRDILLLKYEEGLSVEDIARKLSLTFKSTEARLFRARKAFVTAFGALG
jgi:RNA polymerase sigma factor (sigma-70 family)